MNLRRRTRRAVYIARPQPVQGSMGGVSGQFSAPHLITHGLLLPGAASLRPTAAGLHEKSSPQLLLLPGADVTVGDGVGLAADAVSYRVTRCDRYPLHLVAHLEAVTA